MKSRVSAPSPVSHPATLEMRTLETPTNAVMSLDGRPVINFAGSAYLGISREPELLNAGIDALRHYGARVHLTPEQSLITPAHADVEAEAAKFFGTPAAIYIASGYLIGLTVFISLRECFDLVLLDESGHYNLQHGAAASGATVRTFANLDCTALESALARARRENLRAVVAVDGMCPTYGSIPRLGLYSQLAKEHGALLFIDESHSFGTLGESGHGAAEHCGLTSGAALRGGSLGKAFCAAGAVIVGDADQIAMMRAAPCTRGASWGLVPGAAMAAASLRLVGARPQLLQRLRANVSRAKSAFRQMGIEIENTPAPVATFSVGDFACMQRLQSCLLKEDIFVLHTRYVGTGPDGVIRCSIFADHTDEQIDRLVDALRRHL
jgi:8-amino-7-oxononanoate synthase